MTDAPEFDEAIADALIAAEISAARAFYGEDADGATALLPILHALQARFACVAPQALPLIARRLSISQADVRGVLSFYHDFREAPAGRHLFQLCRAEACQARGSAALEAHVRARLGIAFHETSADGAISLEPVYCLGNCACGPSLRVGDEIVGRVDASRFDALLVALQEDVA